jgi:protein AATF/BFR2
LHDSIADPKYDGVRVSRSRLLDGQGSESSSEEGGDTTDTSGKGSGVTTPDEDESEVESEQRADDGTDEESSSEDEAAQADTETPRHTTSTPAVSTSNDALSVTLKQKREEDVKKGKAVTRQLKLWDSVLDARIRLQKAVGAMNQLPSVRMLNSYRRGQRIIQNCAARRNRSLPN